jgi:phenylalanyl-tRNA synthetase alpha chain
MENDYQLFEKLFTEALKRAQTLEEVEHVEKTYLSRHGKLHELFTAMLSLPPDQKKEWGQKLNILKKSSLSKIEQKKATLQDQGKEQIDVTLRKKLPLISSFHPLSQVEQEVVDIFISMGFEVWDGPEVDTEYHNFEALNIPRHHPARDMQDTFYLEKEPYVLRTQTSNMQNRILKSKKPPIRAIVPGRVFRYEATDARHDCAFYQTEGMMVDTNISVAHMRYVLATFLQALFQKEVKTRFRPGYFPFVEPGMELDFSCTICDGKGCKVCKHTGWVEFLGCGMIHPQVLKEGGIDPEQYTGFAFGFGLTRLVMMKYKIDDIRLLHSGDIRFLKQFAQ